MHFCNYNPCGKKQQTEARQP